MMQSIAERKRQFSHIFADLRSRLLLSVKDEDVLAAELGMPAPLMAGKPCFDCRAIVLVPVDCPPICEACIEDRRR